MYAMDPLSYFDLPALMLFLALGISFVAACFLFWCIAGLLWSTFVLAIRQFYQGFGGLIKRRAAVSKQKRTDTNDTSRQNKGATKLTEILKTAAPVKSTEPVGTIVNNAVIVTNRKLETDKRTRNVLDPLDMSNGFGDLSTTQNAKRSSDSPDLGLFESENVDTGSELNQVGGDSTPKTQPPQSPFTYLPSDKEYVSSLFPVKKAKYQVSLRQKFEKELQAIKNERDLLKALLDEEQAALGVEIPVLGFRARAKVEIADLKEQLEFGKETLHQARLETDRAGHDAMRMHRVKNRAQRDQRRMQSRLEHCKEERRGRDELHSTDDEHLNSELVKAQQSLQQSDAQLKTMTEKFDALTASSSNDADYIQRLEKSSATTIQENKELREKLSDADAAAKAQSQKMAALEKLKKSSGTNVEKDQDTKKLQQQLSDARAAQQIDAVQIKQLIAQVAMSDKAAETAKQELVDARVLIETSRTTMDTAQDVNRLKEQLSNAHQVHESDANKIKELEGRLSNSDALVKSQSTELSGLRNLMQNSRTVVDAAGDVSELQRKLSDAHQVHQSDVNKIKELEVKMSNSDALFKAQSQELSGLKILMQTSRTVVDTARDISELQKRLSEAESRSNKLQNEIDQLKKECQEHISSLEEEKQHLMNTAQNKISLLSEANQELQRNNNQLTQERDDAASKLAEAQRVLAEKTTTSLMDVDLNALQTQLQAAQQLADARAAELQQLHNDLNTANSQFVQQDQRIQSLQQQIEDTRSSGPENAAGHDELARQVVARDQEISSLRNQMQTGMQQYQGLVNEKGQLEAEKKQWQNQLDQVQKQLDLIAIDRDHWLKQFREIDVAHITFQTEHATMRAHDLNNIDQLSQDNRKLRQQIDELTEQVKAANDLVTSSEKDIDDLERRLEEKEQTESGQTDVNVNVNVNSTMALKTMQDQLDKKTDEVQALREKVDELEGLQQTNLDLTGQINLANQQLELQQRDFDKAMDQAQKKQQEIRSALQRVTGQRDYEHQQAQGWQRRHSEAAQRPPVTDEALRQRFETLLRAREEELRKEQIERVREQKRAQQHLTRANRAEGELRELRSSISSSTAGSPVSPSTPSSATQRAGAGAGAGAAGSRRPSSSLFIGSRPRSRVEEKEGKGQDEDEKMEE